MCSAEFTVPSRNAAPGHHPHTSPLLSERLKIRFKSSLVQVLSKLLPAVIDQLKSQHGKTHKKVRSHDRTTAHIPYTCTGSSVGRCIMVDVSHTAFAVVAEWRTSLVLVIRVLSRA